MIKYISKVIPNGKQVIINALSQSKLEWQSWSHFRSRKSHQIVEQTLEPMCGPQSTAMYVQAVNENRWSRNDLMHHRFLLQSQLCTQHSPAHVGRKVSQAFNLWIMHGLKCQLYQLRHHRIQMLVPTSRSLIITMTKISKKNARSEELRTVNRKSSAALIDVSKSC